MRPLHRSRLAALVLVTSAFVLAPATSPGVVGAVSRVTVGRVQAFEFGFKLSRRSAPRGKILFVVKNTGISVHSFRIHGKQTPFIDSLRTARLLVTFTRPGRYPYKCTFGMHAALGMRGVFSVR